VAGAAIEAEAALATSNPKDFQRFEPQGLRLADGVSNLKSESATQSEI
jgi:hypothetical protein